MAGCVISIAAVAVILLLSSWLIAVQMPGRSFRGTPPRLTTSQIALRESLRHDVEELAGRIGERNDTLPDRLNAAAGRFELLGDRDDLVARNARRISTLYEPVRFPATTSQCGCRL